MKMTISLNGTDIVVPCADGKISVCEVTTLAATRYKKAIGKKKFLLGFRSQSQIT